MSDERANPDSQPELPESDQTAEEIAAFAAELGARVPRSDSGRPVAGAPPAAGKPPVATRLSYNVLLLILAVAAITALVALSYSASFRSPAAVTADTAAIPHPQRPGFLDTPPRASRPDSARGGSLRDTGWARESLAVVGEENRLAERMAGRGARSANYGSYEPNADREHRARTHEDATYEKALTAHAVITSRDERQPSEQTASTSLERDSMSFPGVPEFERRSGDFAGGGQLLPQPVSAGNAASRVAMTSGDPSYERRREADSFLSSRRRIGAEPSDQNWGEAGNAVLLEGTVIPAELLTDVNSDLPGEIVGEVTRDVFDSPTQRIILIPKGSRLAGKYDDAVALGQSRLLVAWTRLLLPDGRDVRLPGLESADERGASGVTGSVDSHIGQQFGDALLLSLLGAGVELSQPSGSGAFGAPSVGQAAGAALGQQLSEVALELVRRHADVPPTISLPLGSRFNVYLNRDLVLPPRARPGDPSA